MVGVAQLVERRVVVADVAGSSPVTHPTRVLGLRHEKSAAQITSEFRPALRDIGSGAH
jgi:hypothetical protein